jgi:20S proteasome alpha/beta subunit
MVTMVLASPTTQRDSSHRSTLIPQHLLFPWLVILLVLLRQCHANSSRTTSGILSPVPNWQASWTASQASSTVIAMVYKDCIVLFLQSPSSNVWKGISDSSRRRQANDENVRKRNVYGLALDEQDVLVASTSTSMASLQYAPSWISLSNDNVYQCIISAMTGLAVDVEHLYRVLQKECEDCKNLHQQHKVTTHTFTRRLASILQNECLRPGGRPYGVQVLFAGCDGIIEDYSSGDDRSSTSLCIYSIDPSGNWQSWMKGTAIGQFGPELRHLLGKKMKLADAAAVNSGRRDRINDTDETDCRWWSTGLEGAVECLIECWKETCQQQNMNLRESHEEDYNVLVLKQQRQRRRNSKGLPEKIGMKGSSASSAIEPDSAIQLQHSNRPCVMRLFSVPKTKVDEISNRVNVKLRQGQTN